MRLLSILILLLLSLTATGKPVSIIHQGIKLNAELTEQGNKQQRFFLILHGTLAWHGMELPSTLQTLLEEEEHGSLALSLSYGVTDRKGFYDCKQPITGTHDDAQAEIALWVDYLKNKGYSNIVLIGHSRGGAQMATYALDHPDKVKQVYLIAPMVWQKTTVDQSYKKQTGRALDALLKQKTAQLSHVRALHCKDSQISQRAFASYYSELPQKNTPTLVSKTTVPTTIYLGSDDPLTARLQKQLPLLRNNPNVRIKTIIDADHFFRDFYADEIVSDMLGL